MKRIFVVSLAALLALSAVAVARNSHQRARTYNLTLRAVPVGPYGLMAKVRGKVQVVDGRRNDKASIHVRRLSRRTTFTWHVHAIPAGVTRPCAEPAAGAPSAPGGWRYRRLRSNRAGNANSTARARTFSSTGGFYVDVHLPSGEVVACAATKVKRQKVKKHTPARGHGNGGGKGKKH